MDDDHSLAIYDWYSHRLVCTSKIDKQEVNDVNWRSNLKFVTVG